MDGSEKINVDQLEVEVLIIPKFPMAMSGPAQFLSKRGWPTHIEPNVSKAIDYIMTKKPDFVLISINHPHHNVQRLPTILGKTLDVKCIAFAEIADAKSAALINTAQVEHKVIGHPSGPNIYRAIRKILIDTYAPGTEEKPVADDKVLEKGGNVIRFKAEPKTNYGFQVGAKTDTGKEKKSEDGGTQLDAAAPKRKLKDLLSEKPTKKTNKFADFDANKLIELLEKPTDESNDLLQEGVKTNQGGSITQEGIKQNDGPLITQEGIKHKKPESLIQQAAARGGMSHIRGESDQTNISVNNPSAPTDDAEFDTEDPDKSGKDILSAVDKNDVTMSPEQQSLNDMIENTLNDLKKAATENTEEGTEKLFLLVRQLGVIEVDSQSMHGYIVLGRQDGTALTMQYLELVKADIAKELGGRGIREAMGVCYLFDIPEVNLVEFCEDKTMFAFAIDSDYGNLVGGFLATKGRLAPVEEMPGGKMLRIQSGAVDDTEKISFDAFLHFRKSGRYVRYAKAGRAFLASQIEKIRQKRLALHINKSEVISYRKYLANRFVVLRVREYIEKRQKKAS